MNSNWQFANSFWSFSWFRYKHMSGWGLDKNYLTLSAHQVLEEVCVVAKPLLLHQCWWSVILGVFLRMTQAENPLHEARRPWDFLEWSQKERCSQTKMVFNVKKKVCERAREGFWSYLEYSDDSPRFFVFVFCRLLLFSHFWGWIFQICFLYTVEWLPFPYYGKTKVC